MRCIAEKTAMSLIDKKADYLLMVKGNQPTLQTELRDAIIQAFDKKNAAMRSHRKSEMNRGGEEF
jgi:hypothetical protein